MISAKEAIAIHALLIESFGVSKGVRDKLFFVVTSNPRPEHRSLLKLFHNVTLKTFAWTPITEYRLTEYRLTEY